MLAVAVDAIFDHEGRITPKFYIRNGIKIPVDGINQTWEDQDGIHFIAMIPGDQIVELIFSTKKLLWYFKSILDPMI